MVFGLVQPFFAGAAIQFSGLRGEPDVSGNVGGLLSPMHMKGCVIWALVEGNKLSGYKLFVKLFA